MIVVILIVVIILSAWAFFKKPSHNRNWEVGQEKLPKISIKENEITIENFRDFDWQKDDESLNVYKTERFDLNKIRGVDIVISHFFRFKGLAHIFLSFKFSDNKNLVISLESRREIGEVYSPLWGLFRKFEVIYVVGSEKDIIGVREDVRKEKVHIYPSLISADEARDVLLLIVKDVNNIYNQPAFYNSLFNNCNKVVTKNMSEVLKIKFPFSYKTIFPGFMDEVLFELKLISDKKSIL